MRLVSLRTFYGTAILSVNLPDDGAGQPTQPPRWFYDWLCQIVWKMPSGACYLCVGGLRRRFGLDGVDHAYRTAPIYLNLGPAWMQKL